MSMFQIPIEAILTNNEDEQEPVEVYPRERNYPQVLLDEEMARIEFINSIQRQNQDSI